MSKRKYTNIRDAENTIIKYGGTIVDEKITRPVNLQSGFDPEWTEFWDAYDFLRMKHGYESDADDIIAEIDINEFLNYEP